MATTQLTIQRRSPEKTGDKSLNNFAAWWCNGLSNKFGYDVDLKWRDPKKIDGEELPWVFTADLSVTTERKKFSEDELEEVRDVVAEMSISTRWGKYPFILCDFPNGKGIDPDTIVEAVNESRASDMIQTIYKDWEELQSHLPDLEFLMNASDEEIESMHQFYGIYDRSAVIRVVAASIHKAIETYGRKRNHCLLHGQPAAAKTTVLEAILNYMGDDVGFVMNADTMTSAGVRKLFLDRFEKVPCIVIIEEIEKVTSEDQLKQLLGALDHRATMQKVQHFDQKKREVRFLALATCNDKHKLDMMMGGRRYTANGSTFIDEGALSSRFVNKIMVKRPGPEVMRLILKREIDELNEQGIDAKDEWIEPCLRFAYDEVNNNDPRFILGLLDGGDRLMDGSYQKDRLKIMEVNEHFRGVDIEYEMGV